MFSLPRQTCLPILAIASLLNACGSGQKIDVGESCSLNSDCQSPLVCSMGKCHEACRATTDCVVGQSCIKVGGTGVCQLPAESSCQAVPCGPLLICASDLRCRQQCGSAGDCTADQACVQNACADVTDLDVNGKLPQKASTGSDGGAAAATDGGKADAGLAIDTPAVCPAGAETCPCYGNNTCNDGLTCASRLCVRLVGMDAGAGTGGGTGSGGTSGSGGTTGLGGTTTTSASSTPKDAGQETGGSPADAAGTYSSPKGTVALFHFDGPNGSTTLTDSSGTGKVATIGGNPIISTTQSKFGGASLFVNGGSTRGVDYVAVSAAGSDFSMEGDFTIDWWQYVVKPTNSFVGVVNLLPNDNEAMGGSMNGGGTGLHFNPYYPGSIVAADLLNTWHHVAITRSGTAYRAYVDGKVVYSNSSSNGTLGGSPLAISNPTPGPGDNGDFNGYIDELRVVKGSAVWTADVFTPPTTPY